MQGEKENKNWSDLENESFYSILCSLNFSEEQQSFLYQQIQQFQSSEAIINFILIENPDWEKLLKWVQRENQLKVQEGQKDQIKQQQQLNQQQQNQQQLNQQQLNLQNFNQQQQQTNQQQLMKIRNYLKQRINSNKEINSIIQYIQQSVYNIDIIENVLNCEFESFEEFVQLLKIFEGESKILAQKRTQENITKQQSDNMLYEKQQIEQLFAEFQQLNRRNNLEIQNLFIKIYSSFQNQQIDTANLDFNKSPQLEYQDLYLLCTKVKKHFSYYPRPVQLLSVVELYSHENNQGRLAQIFTGEGKTLIVAMLAILLCKKKKVNVDIVTSSPVLAIRDAQELASFYKLFSISVAHNINGSQNQKLKMFPCYESQVIYGDPHSFQADILRHEYSELGTMGSRQQGYIIVDEVDSMLIDGNSNKTLLSTPIPGMLDLTKVLRLIWDEICKSLPNLSTDKKVMIMNENEYYTTDLDEYVEKTLDLQLKQVVYNFIPKFRINYIKFMKKTWIENAILAKFHFQESKHYLIDNNNVRIIDFQNTGVVHKDNMQWQKGLHQFIQLKHNLPITPLRISTNYLSNVGFFKRYQNQLLGLTGTLGSQVTQNLLAKSYTLDFVFMPPFKKRLLKIQPGIATLSKDEWYQEIQKSVQQQLNSGRAVLIINQTIQDVQKIDVYLKKYKIQSITYTDDQQELKKVIGPKSVIIATNLAGRGTDLTTNEELEKNGGLHVIMSFLPRNIRIQLQGFGRTARQGKLGTAELIVSFPENLFVGGLTQLKTIQDALDYYSTSQKKQSKNYLEVLTFFRDLSEQYYSNEIELEMKKLLNEDKCFKKFCQLAKSKVKINENRAAFQILEEKWGLYLEQFQETGLNEDEIENWLNSDEGQNPKYLVYQGLQKDDLKTFQKAAEISENDPQVQYYKGLSEIQHGSSKEAIQTLEKAKSLFLTKINDEKGFATASKLNRIQVEQFQDNQNLPDFQQSEIKVPKQNLELPDLDLTKDSEITNVSAIEFIKQNNVQKDTIESKINNHLKVYNKVIQNIDSILNTLKTFNPNDEVLDLSWIPVIMKDEKENGDLEQSIKDQQEVIDDGPLPKLGSLNKKKKEKSFFEYIAMFAIGLCQFVVGCAICAFTAGAALPIGQALISEGIADMLLAVQSAWKGIKIDWGTWGQQKVINIAASLALAGPVGIKEALQLGGTSMKTLKKIGITEFLKKIPEVTIEGLKKSGFWLTDLEQQAVEQKYQSLQDVIKLVQNATNYAELENLFQNYNELDSGVLEIISQSFQESKGSVDGFKKCFCQLAQKYIKLSMAKCKQGSENGSIKKKVIEIGLREGNKKYKQVKNDIEDYNQYKEAMNNELNYFSTKMLDYYQKDQEIQRIAFFLDYFYQKLCDQEQVFKTITNKMIQALLSQSFNVQNMNVQNACNQLQISNSQSMNKFYQGIMRPVIYNLCNELGAQSKYKDPLEMILKNEYKQHYNAKLEQLQNELQNLTNYQQQVKSRSDQCKLGNKSQQEIDHMNQMIVDFNQKRDLFNQQQHQLKEAEKLEQHELVKNIIDYLKREGMIMDDSLTFKPQYLNVFNQYLKNQNFNDILKQILLLAMQSIPKEIDNFKSTSKKLFSNKLLQAIEIVMLDEIKKYIFESRMQKADEKIASKID
ncbi:unnamed protein product (macronuclear) [Paramecium tetraurelia]|uniref:Uncharacterized protein n=1 Tax=Paramecium tetraurelia TaxID=5888 RepID=A0BEU6_PARTE|nr:uncharacterized protein GSPATT00028096001 [Paramecium tetraurelia]CAK57063.1 unnamed protein product [Paramecium tetraurelia]|eukprot:XP_001424461.1 hypothetical protein (macronuclear) [Paramecium tetraurelia strain d4-2]